MSETKRKRYDFSPDQSIKFGHHTPVPDGVREQGNITPHKLEINETHSKENKTFRKPNLSSSTNWIRTSSYVSAPIEKQFIYSKPVLSSS